MSYKNLPQLFFARVSQNKFKTALEYRIRKSEPYKSISWNKFGELVSYFACGLLTLGLRKGETVSIISDTRYEWAISDLAVLSIGGIVVPVYPTLPDGPVNYILNNANVEIAILENKGQLQKIRGQWDKFNNIKYVIVIDDFGDLPGNDPRILSFNEVLTRGEKFFNDSKDVIQNCVSAIDRNEEATIIYTSGTTGNPKGVLLTHNNILSVVESLPKILTTKPKDKFLSFLPMSHVFERVGSFYYCLFTSTPVSYCSSQDRIGKALLDSGATAMCVVPRLLEKMYAKINEEINNLPDKSKRIVSWAFANYKGISTKADSKRPLSNIKQIIALNLIFSKIRKKVAPTLRYFISGGAPLSREIADFFWMIGLPVLEGYGLTETSAPATVNTLTHNKLGTVGKAIPGVKIKIAEDGEILIKGDTIFSCYYNNPQATSDTFVDGWFKSGDIGEIDSHGFLKITDRKKDLIINSAGKNIAPQNIENSIKTSQYISNVVIIGDKRKYLSALVTLEKDPIKKYAIANNINFNEEKIEEIYNKKEIYKLIDEEIKFKTSEFADYEQIIKFTILKNDFSISNGELTPTMKLKRSFVSQKYKDLIDAMY